MRPSFRDTILLVLVLFVASCSRSSYLGESDFREGKPARNVIFLVGDGMGLAQVSAGVYAPDNLSVFLELPVTGLIKTDSHDRLITDSAAGATAFSTGKKTKNGAIGVDPEGRPLPTLFEEGFERGYKTGLAVTCEITHATPASFYAHDESRQAHEAIAEDFSLSQVDVAIGYGRQYFNRREDQRDLLQVLRERDFEVWEQLEDMKVRRNRRQVVLLEAEEPPRASQRPRDFLQRSVALSLEQLSAGREPFLLLVEGAQIDWAGHANDTEYLVEEQLDFEAALREALEWAREDGQTLVVVTADHETGGFALTGEARDSLGFEGSFSTGKHTATMVPVFAYGPGAVLFSGVYENTAIHSKLRRALGW
jgi:alkaline phosphatase